MNSNVRLLHCEYTHVECGVRCHSRDMEHVAESREPKIMY